MFYPPNLLNAPTSLKGFKLTVGKMLPPVVATRVVDANVVHLEQEVPLDGRWRIYVFSGDLYQTEQLSSHLTSNSSFYTTRKEFFQLLFIIPKHRTDIDIEKLPSVVKQNRDFVYADDRKDYIWANGKTEAIHFKYGFDVDKGGVLVTRPDGYVAFATEIEGAGQAVDGYFNRFIVQKDGGVGKDDRAENVTSSIKGKL